MKITLVAALDNDYGIGQGNQMPWHLPADFQQFKQYTMGKPLVMGRLTALSLGRALPGRRNLVLTRTQEVPFNGMEPISDLGKALDELRGQGTPEVCVIGGGQVFAMALPLATDMHLTWVNAQVPADVVFPRFDPTQWQAVSRTPHPRDDRHAYDFSVIHYHRLAQDNA